MADLWFYSRDNQQRQHGVHSAKRQEVTGEKGTRHGKEVEVVVVIKLKWQIYGFTQESWSHKGRHSTVMKYRPLSRVPVAATLKSEEGEPAGQVHPSLLRPEARERETESRQRSTNSRRWYSESCYTTLDI
jgi:hypothetical protein